MGLLNLLGPLSPVHIRLVTLLRGGKPVGEDQFGNKYYRATARPGYKRERRWVIYAGLPEATSVPPEWHGWLHYQTDELPGNVDSSYRKSWQKPHSPNMTGMQQTYRPPGHVLAGGKRDRSTGDYEPWTPTE